MAFAVLNVNWSVQACHIACIVFDKVDVCLLFLTALLLIALYEHLQIFNFALCIIFSYVDIIAVRLLSCVVFLLHEQQYYWHLYTRLSLQIFNGTCVGNMLSVMSSTHPVNLQKQRHRISNFEYVLSLVQ